MILHFLLAQALASSFNIPPFSEFTREANTIVRGTVSNIHVENAINDAGTKVIYTYAALEVKDVIKGTPGRGSIQIRKIGGTKDGVSLEIPGSPEFVNGEDNVFFLSAQKNDQSYEIDSLELGQYGVHENNGETELVGGIFNYTKHDDHNAGTEHAENQHVWTLNELRKVVADQKVKSNPSPTQTGAAVSALAPKAVSASPSPSMTVTRDQPETKFYSDAPSPEAPTSTLGKVFIFIAFGLILLTLIFFFRKR